MRISLGNAPPRQLLSRPTTSTTSMMSGEIVMYEKPRRGGHQQILGAVGGICPANVLYILVVFFPRVFSPGLTAPNDKQTSVPVFDFSPRKAISKKISHAAPDIQVR